MDNNIQPTQTNDISNKTNVIDNSSEKESKWNKLAVLSILMVLIWILSFLSFGLLYNPNLPIYKSFKLHPEIYFLQLSILIISPVLALIFGCISYFQIKKTREKGGLLSIYAIVFGGLPVFLFVCFMFFIIFLVVVGGVSLILTPNFE